MNMIALIMVSADGGMTKRLILTIFARLGFERTGNFMRNKGKFNWESYKKAFPSYSGEFLITYTAEEDKSTRFVAVAFFDETTGKWISKLGEFEICYGEERVIAWTDIPRPYEGDF